MSGSDAVEPCSGGVVGRRWGTAAATGELDQFVDGVGGRAEVGGEHFGRCGGGGEADDVAATVGPRRRQRRHGGGLAGAGGGQGELHARTGGGHVAQQGLLAVVEFHAVLRVGFEHGHANAGVIDDVAPGKPGRGEDSPLGGQDLGAGVDGAVVAGVDAGAVAAAQRGGLPEVGVGGGGQGDAVLAQSAVDDACRQLWRVVAVGVAQHP